MALSRHLGGILAYGELFRLGCAAFGGSFTRECRGTFAECLTPLPWHDCPNTRSTSATIARHTSCDRPLRLHLYRAGAVAHTPASRCTPTTAAIHQATPPLPPASTSTVSQLSTSPNGCDSMFPRQPNISKLRRRPSRRHICFASSGAISDLILALQRGACGCARPVGPPGPGLAGRRRAAATNRVAARPSGGYCAHGSVYGTDPRSRTGQSFARLRRLNCPTVTDCLTPRALHLASAKEHQLPSEGLSYRTNQCGDQGAWEPSRQA
jgi:hypothetical protein